MPIGDKPIRPVVVLKPVDLEGDQLGGPSKVQARYSPPFQGLPELAGRGGQTSAAQHSQDFGFGHALKRS